MGKDNKKLLFKFAIPLLLIVILFILYNTFQKKLLNPKERNYITFGNTSIEEIIDSLDKLNLMLNEYHFQVPEYNWIAISSSNQKISCLDVKRELFHLDSINQLNCFKNLSEEQLKNFLNLFTYIFNNGLNGFNYSYDDKQLILFYKDYFLFYDSPWYSDDMMRFLIYEDNFYNIDFSLYKLLDSTKNLYLVAFNDSEIFEDDSKYYIRSKHKLQNRVKKLLNKK